MNRTVEERFWEKVQKTETCWLWMAGLSRGYGDFRVNGRTVKAHRFSWTLAKGPIPTEAYNGLPMCVCHSCDVRACVRPDHLFLGPQLANMQDKVSKNRQASREANGRAKLTSTLVEEIRAMYKTGLHTQREIGDANGVSDVLISLIVRNKIWKTPLAENHS